jgi:hypothetical protein
MSEEEKKELTKERLIEIFEHSEGGISLCDELAIMDLHKRFTSLKEENEKLKKPKDNTDES